MMTSQTSSVVLSQKSVFDRLWQKALALAKVTVIASMIAVYLTLAFLMRLFIWDSFKLTWLRTRWISLCSRFSLKVLNVSVDYQERVAVTGFRKNCLLVCNHLSYLDVLVLAARYPSCFVTSLEVRQTPGLGQICEAGGCVFVDRRTRQNLAKEVAQITRALAGGLNVIIFPEATSTNGENVLRFRRPLYRAAIDSESPVQPLCLNYRKVDGYQIDAANRDRVFWYGDMSFLPHLWRLALCQSVHAEVQALEALPSKGSTEAFLAEVSHQRVSKAFSPIKP